MNLSKLQVIIVDDDIYKAVAIERALKFNGIHQVQIFNNQEKVWDAIYEGKECGESVDLIVTDMQYPLSPRTGIDDQAGFKLIERLKKENLDIPVIICSSKNYMVPEILGTVWYNRLNDIELAFREVLNRLT